MTAHDLLRIAHLDHTSTNGGAEYALRRLLLAEPSWSPAVVLPRRQAGEEDIFTPALGPNVVSRIGPAQPAGASRGGVTRSALLAGRLGGQALALRARRRLGEADVVHANSTRSAVYGAMALAGSGTPLVVHLRDLITPESIGRAGFELFTRVALARASAVISNSATTLSSAESFIPPSTIVEVIPSAAGITRQVGRVNWTGSVRRIGMVARIDPWKGQDLLLRAFAMADLAPDARLVFAGSAPFGTEPFLEELRSTAARLGVSDRVDFLGHVEDVNAFIDDMDVCVQCSTRPEPLGQNVLQYLARGAAVVAADEGGPTEWVVHEKNGLLFRSGDVAALAAALTRLGDEQGLRSAIAEAASHTAGLRDDVTIMAAHAEVFGRVLAARRTAVAA